MLDYFQYTINEDVWTVYLIDDDDDVIADASSAAEVKFQEKELYVRKGEISKEVLLHEIWHVFFGYCYLQNTVEMSLHDIEEVCASLFADRCEHMLNVTKEITDKLNQLKESHG